MIITTYTNNRWCSWLLWVLVLGFIPLAGLWQADKAYASASWSSCSSVQASVYVSINSSSTGALCSTEGNVTLPNVSEAFTVIVHVYGGVPEGNLTALLAANGEVQTTSMNGLNSLQFPDNYSGGQQLSIGILEYPIGVYARASGSIYFNKSFDDYVNTVALGEPVSYSIQPYDIFVAGEEFSNKYLQIIDGNKNALTSEVQLNGTVEKLLFTSIPIAGNDFVYVVSRYAEAPGLNDVIPIGFIEVDNVLMKFEFSSEVESFSVEPYRNASGSTAKLHYKNFAFILESVDSESDLFPLKDQIFKVSRLNGAGAVVETMLITQSYMPFIDESYFDLNMDDRKTVQVVLQNGFNNGTTSLAGIRVIEENTSESMYFPWFNYSYTDEQGKATLLNTKSSTNFYTVVPERFDMYEPQFVQVGDSVTGGGSLVTLTVVPLKRPGAPVGETSFNLQDLVWFAQNKYDISLDGVVASNDIEILLRLLVPYDFMPLFPPGPGV